MLKRLLDAAFGCRHESCTFPITRRFGNLQITTRTCLHCGLDRKYSFEQMRFVKFEKGEERHLRTRYYGSGLIAD